MIVQLESGLGRKAIHARHIGKVRERKLRIGGQKFGEREQVFAGHEQRRLSAKGNQAVNGFRFPGAYSRDRRMLL
jgi:hypothetical protein